MRLSVGEVTKGDGLDRHDPAAPVYQSTDGWAEITLEDDMGLSGTGGESMAAPEQSPAATFKRFRDVTPTTEVPGSAPKVCYPMDEKRRHADRPDLGWPGAFMGTRSSL